MPFKNEDKDKERRKEKNKGRKEIWEKMTSTVIQDNILGSRTGVERA